MLSSGACQGCEPKHEVSPSVTASGSQDHLQNPQTNPCELAAGVSNGGVPRRNHTAKVKGTQLVYAQNSVVNVLCAELQ